MAFSVDDPREALTAGDLAKAVWLVRHRSSARLAVQDCEDIASTMVIDALTAHRKHGDPTIVFLHRNLRRPSYYSRKRRELNRHQSVVPLSDDVVAEPLPRRSAMSEGAAAGAMQEPGQWGVHPDGFGAQVEFEDLLARIPRNHARAVYLVGYAGYTLAEASQVLGVAPQTVHRWLREGRLSLQGAWQAAEAA